MIFDTLGNIEKYKGISANLDQAIDFIMQTDFSKSETGRTDVCGAFYYTKAVVQTGDISAAPFDLLEGGTQANVINTPDTFTILFPQDAHNSAGGVDGEVIDFEKIVVKVRVS